MYRNHKITLQQLRDHLAPFNIVSRPTGYGDEVRVNFKGGKEATAYYTDDREDALNTGIKMAETQWRNTGVVKPFVPVDTKNHLPGCTCWLCIPRSQEAQS